MSIVSPVPLASLKSVNDNTFDQPVMLESALVHKRSVFHAGKVGATCSDELRIVLQTTTARPSAAAAVTLAANLLHIEQGRVRLWVRRHKQIVP